MESMQNVENGIFTRVAEHHGVERHTVCSEIATALSAARGSKTPSARAFWETVPKDATAADILRRIVELI